MSMLEIVKRVAAETDDTGAPAALLFGVVTSREPVRISVESRFEIGGDAVVLLRQQQGGFLGGERVALLRDRGGQRFLVLGVL